MPTTPTALPETGPREGICPVQGFSVPHSLKEVAGIPSLFLRHHPHFPLGVSYTKGLSLQGRKQPYLLELPLQMLQLADPGKLRPEKAEMEQMAQALSPKAEGLGEVVWG